MRVPHVTLKDFDHAVLQSKSPVFVDFYASWCPPCRQVAPVIEKLAEEFRGRVKFVKVNVEEEPRLAARYAIMAIPTLMFFRNGEPVDVIQGAQPQELLEGRLEELAAAA